MKKIRHYLNSRVHNIRPARQFRLAHQQKNADTRAARRSLAMGHSASSSGVVVKTGGF
jgi:hypothetical protein